MPTPEFIDNSISGVNVCATSVFTNPFKEAENAKQAILEKHVKMVSTQNSVKIINGKKICWNYRKGKCRFGHNCIYAHDSDVQKSKEQLELESKRNEIPLYQNQHSVEPNVNVILSQNAPVNQKKRPGLTQGLIPGKKIMKTYKKQQFKMIYSTTKN